MLDHGRIVFYSELQTTADSTDKVAERATSSSQTSAVSHQTTTILSSTQTENIIFTSLRGHQPPKINSHSMHS